MDSVRRLVCSGWLVAWLISMAASLGGALVLLSAAAWQWALFLSTQIITSVALFAYLRQAAYRYAKSQTDAEQPLWRATALAIHDMGTPLHVLRFCIGQLAENPAVTQTPKFMEQLTRSSDRTTECFEQLRNYVRAVRDEEGPSELQASLGHAVRVVQAKFPDHPGAKSIDLSSAPDERIAIGTGPLVRSLAVLMGRCLGNPGSLHVSAKAGGELLHIAISSDSNRDCASHFETQSVSRWVKEWGGKLSRTTVSGSGVGYALHLEREGRS